MITPADILKARILIVDDLQVNITLLERTLRGAGYESISSTRDPHQVCELHRKNRYALILLDLEMPGMDGFQVMEAMKALESGSYLPVLVITAQPQHKLRALKSGARDFVSKPVDLTEVLMRVHNLVEVHLLNLAAEARTEQAEGRFIEAQKMDALGQLATGVAHDFNNIIAIVMGYSEMAMEKLGPGNDLIGDLETIRAACERAAGLTRQLLIFSRKQEVRLVILDLNDVLKDMRNMLPRLVDENIEMTMLPGNLSGRIKADTGYVGQVLMNLVVNARDAMPNGGRLAIATGNATLDENWAGAHPGAKSGQYIFLSVSDTGTGMTDEVKARMFEPLFTTKPKGQGTGLGLATCQTIVQQAGGYIEVQSEIGKGSTFKAYFPRVEQPLEPVARPAHVGSSPHGSETLLIVEDDPSVRHLANDIFRSLGYNVLRAANGQHALDVAREHKGLPIDLVITDVIMPVMGGRIMVEWLRSEYPELKILFTSGYPDDSIKHHGVFQPGIEFLPKPYSPATIARRVREMLDRPVPPESRLVPEPPRPAENPAGVLAAHPLAGP
jgi:signal transduction histidine kinase